MATTVLIVDDHPSFRAVARTVLELDGFDVIGEARNGAEAIQRAAHLRPDVVLLDVNLPDLDGFAVTRQLLRGPDQAPWVVLTSTRDGTDFGTAVVDSGARGFIPKTELSGATLTRLLA